MGMATQAGVIGLTQHKGALGSNPRSGNFFAAAFQHRIETTHEFFILFYFCSFSLIIILPVHTNRFKQISPSPDWTKWLYSWLLLCLSVQMIMIYHQNSIAAQAGVIGLTQHKGALGSNPRSGNLFCSFFPATRSKPTMNFLFFFYSCSFSLLTILSVNTNKIIQHFPSPDWEKRT